MRLSQRVMARGELGAHAICCLLHNLTPGGSARQWINLLAAHVAAGGRATILAPPGPLRPTLREAGIELVPVRWGSGLDGPALETIGRHDAAVVHWDHGVVDAFGPALDACGRAALTIHQAPRALERWFGPEVLERSRRQLELAAGDRRAVVLVRGEAHRRRFVEELDLAPERLRVLPASVRVPPAPPRPAGEPGEVLALMRLSPDKEAVARLAVELVAAGLRAGGDCRLSIAGEGPWRGEAERLCRAALPDRAWRIEPAPEDPLGRLAAADLVVAQGLTTLEAAALERRVVVARMTGGRPAGAVLRTDNYEEAARDPFARPHLTEDPERLWREALALKPSELRQIRALVERHNGIGAGTRAFRSALAETSATGRLRRTILRG